MVRHPNPVLIATKDGCDLSGAEIAEHPQQDHIGLVAREVSGDEIDSMLRAPVVQRQLFARTDSSIVGYLGHGVGLSTAPGPSIVGQPLASDREEPCGEGPDTTLERADLSGDCDPRLAGDVVGTAWLPGAQIPEQARVKRTKQRREPCLIAAPGGFEVAGEHSLVGR
jgi:hypothetical protein